MPANYSEDQLKAYERQRANYFKGTIAVCVVYGLIALGLLIVATMSVTGKAIITGELMPFMITFVGGMIFVIVALLVSLFSAKPPQVSLFEYDKLKCPDYWRLQETNASQLAGFPEDIRARMRYVCKRDTAISEDKPDANVTANNNQDDIVLLRSSMAMYNYLSNDLKGGTGKVNCNTVYPDYMASVDGSYDSSSGNKVRCRYATHCKTPWSSTCPKVPDV